MWWCTEWCYFSPGSKSQLEKLGQEIPGKEKTWICAFFKAAAPPGTADVTGKAAAAPCWASCARGKSEVCQCPAVSCSAQLPHCHPLSSLLALPVPGRGAELVAEPLLCCAVLCCAVLLAPFHTHRISVLFPSTAKGASCGAEKKEISISQGRKIRVNFFPSFTWHNPTKWMLHYHCQLLFSCGCSVRDTSKMGVFLEGWCEFYVSASKSKLEFLCFFYILKLAQTWLI